MVLDHLENGSSEVKDFNDEWNKQFGGGKALFDFMQIDVLCDQFAERVFDYGLNLRGIFTESTDSVELLGDVEDLNMDVVNWGNGVVSLVFSTYKGDLFTIVVNWSNSTATFHVSKILAHTEVLIRFFNRTVSLIFRNNGDPKSADVITEIIRSVRCAFITNGIRTDNLIERLEEINHFNSIGFGKIFTGSGNIKDVAILLGNKDVASDVLLTTSIANATRRQTPFTMGLGYALLSHLFIPGLKCNK